MPPRHRSFQGCWTCRARKVKCDQGRPRCQRCIKSKRECLGFEIKLCWSAPLSIDDTNELVTLGDDDMRNGFQRRKVDIFKFPSSMVYTYKELNDTLEQLDMAESSHNIGPFRVYKLREEKRKKGHTLPKIPTQLNHDIQKSIPMQSNHKHIQNPISPHRPSSFETEPILSPDFEADVVVNSPGEDAPYDSTKSIFSKSNNSWVHYELMDYAKLTILAIKGTNYRFNEQNMLHILYPKFFPNIDSDDWLVDTKILDKLFEYNKSTFELRLKKVFHDLLKNFKSDIFSFCRVFHTPNYFDCFVIPYIKQIFGEFICFDFTNTSDLHLRDDPETFSAHELKQNIKLAIVYLVLGLSSFKMSKSTHRANADMSYHMDEYLKISISLRKLSIRIINYHLDEYDKNSIELEKCGEAGWEYETLLLLGSLLQIDLDNKYSVYENFELIFAIGDYVIKNKSSHTRLGSLSKFLINVFRIEYTFFESTQSINLFNYSISEGDEEINYRDLSENYDLAKNIDTGGVEAANEDDDDEDDENVAILPNGKKATVQIKPTIQNLLISNRTDAADYSPLSFSISFNKRELTGYNEASEPPESKTVKAKKVVPKTNLTEVFELDQVYVMYGLPKSLVYLFDEIIHLTNHKNIFERRRVFPRNFPKICADVEDKLLQWKVADYWDLDPKNPLHQYLGHGIESFHSSLIVYYNRLIKGVSSRNISVVQEHVTRALHHLHEAIRLSKAAGHVFRPLFWILLVCGSEVKDPAVRKDIEALWSADVYRNQSNCWRGKQILYEIWKRRDLGEEYGFMDMVREWDVVLCLG